VADAEVHGTCDRRFQQVKDVFHDNLRLGADLGASVAVTLDGKIVVDLWGGFADEGRTTPWHRDTLVNLFSTTKVMTALCALALVDSGDLDLDAPVARYWPEFEQGGKGAVRVRWVLAHSAGLPGFEHRLPADALFDWDRIVGELQRQSPWWEPGTQSGYHMITFGYLVGELVRRISGKTLGAFFREQIAGPLNADAFIGLPAAQDSRVAHLVAPPPVAQPDSDALDTVASRTLTNPAIGVELTRTTAWRRAEIPASNGFGHARAAALVGSVLACSGKVAGRRYVSGQVVDQAFEEQSFGIDLVLGVPVRWGLGFGLAGPHRVFLSPQTAYWGGTGGSFLLMDRDARMSFSYAMNRMRPEPPVVDPRGLRLREALFSALRR
jgi:CubicO group peptidase (beta-lactamase class C family)